ncbi:hypothetical protein [Ruegeria meonggei]|uniref:hypothetical protein n=1 Tax=Ruegeria meonggei TaxID=1446476 RepID=UPI00366ACB93
MIFEIFGALVLFVAACSLLPLMIFVLWVHERSKRAVIEGMAQLDVILRDRLGWQPEEYFSRWNIGAPFRLGWQAWGALFQQQALALQRVLVRGLPEFPGIPDEVRKAARTYRRCFGLVLIVGAVVVFLPAYHRLSLDVAEYTGWPESFWFAVFGLAVGILVFLPTEKFRKWPELEAVQ